MNATVNTSCKKCGARHEMPAYSSIDISADPSLKEKVVSGELFTRTCSSCGTVNLVKYPFMYHDPAQKLLLVLSDAALKAESVPEGYTARRVRSVGELIEKIKISGLTCKLPWGGYPKSLHSLNMKNGRSDTPLS